MVLCESCVISLLVSLFLLFVLLLIVLFLIVVDRVVHFEVGFAECGDCDCFFFTDFVVSMCYAQSSEIPTVTSQYDEKTVEQVMGCW